MKKIIFIFTLCFLAGCSPKVYTPYPETDSILFEKEGGKITLGMSGPCYFYYDKDLGYKETPEAGDMLYSTTLECGWVTFIIENYYEGDIHYMEPRLIIITESNDTSTSRTLTMEFEDVLCGRHSGRSSITVYQKGK